MTKQNKISPESYLKPTPKHKLFLKKKKKNHIRLLP